MIMLQVNGENLLTLEYERDTHSETIYNRDLNGLLTVRYNSAGQPTHFLPYGNQQVFNRQGVNILTQESIPVGYLTPTCQPYLFWWRH